MKYMTSETNSISDEQKEMCAVRVMRSMLEDYTDENSVVFEEALLKFASSNTYKMLFDYSTGIWKEGPDYLAGLYQEELDEQECVEINH